MPFCNIVLHARKPILPTYLVEVKTLGDRIKKKRLELGLTRRATAKIMKVPGITLKQWETNITSPRVGGIAKVIKFLGYNPYGELENMTKGEKLTACRMRLGLTQREAAKQIGVNQDTIQAWEKGGNIRNKAHKQALEAFIAAAYHDEMT